MSVKIFSMGKVVTDSFDTRIKAVDMLLEQYSKNNIKRPKQALAIFQWISLMAEEFGEIAKASNDYDFGSAEKDEILRECSDLGALLIAFMTAIMDDKDPSSFEW